MSGECEHPGRHCRPNNCIECGLFSSDSWTTDWYYTQNGGQQDWGGVCKVHGAWSESAA